ncbi:MAG: 16S rRNA (adenine(1518)-N(6)/adenine(1519)-N(6))-dimethyltransferase RsmA [Planctomycetes bacterium]|nr:16S rRNA (adenine(1518)-N(6)/adenine(1519)-N(6))-dimethyltransferase RsmA [Planctomycetota bacterium]
MKRGELRALLEAHGLSPRQIYGQNFLIDPALLAAIPQDAGVLVGDRVLEVGPGAGSLTRELLDAGAQVYAVEIDAGMVKLLRERFAAELESDALRLLHADVLAADEELHAEVESWWRAGSAPRVVANLPYAISGPFLARLIGRPLMGATLLLQREVAEKAASRTETGPLPIRLGQHFAATVGRKVPAQVFWPRPKVDSAFLQLVPLDDAPNVAVDAALRRLLRESFSQRRKRVLGLLGKSWPAAAACLTELGVLPDARAEQVEPNLWRAAAQELARHGDCV